MTGRQVVAAATVLALTICYAPTLRGMFDQWSTDEDMSHGFLVPIVVLWIVWRERQRWGALPMTPSWWGFAILAAAAVMQALGAIGAGLFASSVAFLFSVTGAVVCLGGFALLRAWTFPLLLAVFMLPKLAIVYNQATLPLQLTASRMAAAMLSAARIGVVREGNILDVAGRRISVAEACNGIRYLLPLCFTAVVLAYLADTKVWMRIALLAAAIPIAILANALRVAAAAAVPGLEAGTPHELAGIVIFVLCLAMLILCRTLFHSIYVRSHPTA